MAALLLLGGARLSAQQPAKPSAPSPAAKPTQTVAAPGDTAKRAGMPRDTSKAAAAGDSAKAARAARDSAQVDSVLARRKRLLADTLKAPLARAEMPLAPDGSYHWRGEALRAAGAITLADLLQRVPGATSLRANWIPAPQYLAYNGDAGRVRVFRDGVEVDAIDARNGQVLDLSVIPLWTIEEVSVERAPGELRVYLRSWRVDKTTPYTRTDITTGSENTNLYRGYFGRRFHNGAAIQLAAQQFSTTSPRTGGDGSSLQIFGRVGWVWKKLSVDGVWNRVGLDRAATIRFPLANDPVKNGAPAYKGTIGNSYARVAWGDPDAVGAPWIQLIASSQMLAENSKVSSTSVLTSVTTTVVKDTVDTLASRSQYVLSAGASRWGVKGSVAARMRVIAHKTEVSPSLRLGYDWRFVSLGGFAETRGADSTSRSELSVRVAPWSWLAVTASQGTYDPKSATTGGPKFTARRAELSTQLFGVTMSGGVITRGATSAAAVVGLDSAGTRVGTGEAKGGVFALRGLLWRDLGFDVNGVLWDSQGAYRPQMEVHSSLFVDTSFPNRFPRNNFHLFASATYDHRSPLFFPTKDGGVGPSTGPTEAIGARLEIRIESGTVFFQSENIAGRLFESAPGYLMPRRLQYYGLRWEFWN